MIAVQNALTSLILAWALGADPSEPDNAEAVALRVLPDGNHVAIRYRDGEWRCELPT